ncbi:hypothetical protein EXIGLDRAFT_730396 [Exidia glandulosa HHB12029]|uniref:Protein kinase domain-containing protein n=1 Tax=Exidia glandulosa HHB12029 TaxID=1314781 RepID=A0A165C605_EXIGL|nr:hypothetical protein EXIGLDRAFT_730396 [Exidia glandulosa HHB12029]
MPSLDLTNSATLDAFYTRMKKFRAAARASPIEQGHSFTLKLTYQASNAPNGHRRRHINPDLQALVSKSSRWYLQHALQSAPGQNAQVWLATPNPDAETQSSQSAAHCIVLKIMQESFTDFPNPRWSPDDLGMYRTQEDRVSTALSAYERLSDLQGSALPYFFGLTVTTASWGEKLHILAFEYLPEPSLETVDHDRTEFVKWTDHKTYFTLAKSAVNALQAAHERNVLHTDLASRNIVIDSANQQLVIIDWERCEVDVRDRDDRAIREQRTLVGVLCRVVDGASPTGKAIGIWANGRIPGLNSYVSN